MEIKIVYSRLFSYLRATIFIIRNYYEVKTVITRMTDTFRLWHTEVSIKTNTRGVKYITGRTLRLPLIHYRNMTLLLYLPQKRTLSRAKPIDYESFEL